MGKRNTARNASTLERPPKNRAKTTATVATLAVVAGYVFVSGTFTLPDSPARAAVVDGFAPYFSQQWDVFAPRIVRTNSSLELQAQWRDDSDGLVHSAWVPVTEMEQSAVRGVPIPSRIAKNTVNAASIYLSRYEELSEDQQERVQDTFIEAIGGRDFAPIPEEELTEEIDEMGDDSSAVVRFLRYDQMLVRFADAFTEAHFGREIERVRWRVRFDRPNDFAERFEPQQEPTSYVTFGWRQPGEDTQEKVAEVFNDIEERYGL